jgi:hypothetical protein
VAISLAAFSSILGGMLLGLYLRNILPQHHLSEESKDAVKLGIGMLATLSALVLALLMASAKSSYDTTNSELRHAGSRIILLDQVMAHYGPETMEARDLLRRIVAHSIEQRWPEDKTGPAVAKAPKEKAYPGIFLDKLHQLSPRTDAQRWRHSRALQLSSDIAEGRWLLFEQAGQTSLPMPFVVFLIFWLTFIFAAFGLISPPNATVVTILIVCALSVAGSLFLIMELDTPYCGLIKVSSAPLHNALIHIGGITTGTPQ